jgi:hypothetical protein
MEVQLLTKRHLAVLRAALQYFDEELSPHGMEAMKDYFDRPLDEDLTREEVQQLREFLRGCKLRYACCDPKRKILLNPKLSVTVKGLNNISVGKNVHVAAVLLPTSD